MRIRGELRHRSSKLSSKVIFLPFGGHIPTIVTNIMTITATQLTGWMDIIYK